jgi:hypothetical protein
MKIYRFIQLFKNKVVLCVSSADMQYFYGGRYGWVDTSAASLIVHLWLYTAHCSIPLVYRTGHKGAHALHAA